MNQKPFGRLLTLALVTLCSAATNGCKMEFTRIADAVVLETKGIVTNSVPGATPRALIPKGQIVVPTTVDSAQDGVADVSLLPGALIEVAPETHLGVERLELSKNGNRVQEAMRRRITLSLAKGRISGSVAFEPEESAVEISAADGVLTVQTPALFSLAATGGKMRLVCAHGTVLWRAKDGSVKTVTGPAVWSWPPPPAESVPARFDPEATEEIENLREVERKLLGLQDSSRLAPYPWRQ